MSAAPSLERRLLYQRYPPVGSVGQVPHNFLNRQAILKAQGRLGSRLDAIEGISSAAYDREMRLFTSSLRAQASYGLSSLSIAEIRAVRPLLALPASRHREEELAAWFAIAKDAVRTC